MPQESKILLPYSIRRAGACGTCSTSASAGAARLSQDFTNQLVMIFGSEFMGAPQMVIFVILIYFNGKTDDNHIYDKHK